MTTALEDLLYEVRVTYQSLLQLGDAIHAESGLSMGSRAILEYLDRHGDTTMPDIARARRVTRQRIQALVIPLLEKEFVAMKDNPATRRSPLVSLTTGGKQCIDNMRKREGRFLRVRVPASELAQAQATLERVRAQIEAGEDD